VAGDLGEHVALVAHMLDLLEADHVDLAQDLEREDLVLIAGLRVLEPHQPYARKGAWRTVSIRSPSVSRAGPSWPGMRTRAERLDQLEVVLAQHLGRVAHGLARGVHVDLVGAERVLVGLPLRQLLLLLLARLVHGRVGAVVQRARMRRRGTLPLFAVVLQRVQQLEGSRHGGGSQLPGYLEAEAPVQGRHYQRSGRGNGEGDVMSRVAEWVTWEGGKAHYGGGDMRRCVPLPRMTQRRGDETQPWHWRIGLFPAMDM
jgi:hypothetical protein